MRPRSVTQGVRRRVIAAAMAAVLGAQSGCSSYRAIPLTRLEIPSEVNPRPGEERPRIRYVVRDSEQSETMEVRAIDGPYLVGVRTEGHPPAATSTDVRLDTRRLVSLEVYSSEARVWTLVGIVTSSVVGVAGAVLGVVIAVALANKSSCPFIFVETADGVRFAGESYSGSVVRPLQRDDLLALPPTGDGEVRIALSNHAHETQYTDHLALWLVDHAPEVRAVADADAHPILVAGLSGPTAVLGLDGAPRSPPGSEAGAVWESDMIHLVEGAEPPLRDGLVLTFAAPADNAAPVLELDVANTHWLDLVLGRMFASFGDRLRGYLADLDARTEDPGQRAWREREGVNLEVEAWIDGRWQRAAWIPTPGPAALRHLAVVLPQGRRGEPVRVRLSAGTGFWRIGAVGLSALRDPSPPVTRLAPTRAVQPDGSDGRSLLAATDGRYQALAVRGDRLELTFAPSPAPAGTERASFLFANGYYSVHAQPQAEFSRATLLRLRDEAGAMVRFSFDLYRELLRVVREAPSGR